MSEARIRMGTPGDAAGMIAISAPITATAINFHYQVPSVADKARTIAEQLATHPLLVLEEGAGIVGFASASRYRPSVGTQWGCETSIALAEQARGRGLGRALYGTLLEALAIQGFCNAYAGVTIPNPASEQLHLSLGFTEAGRFRRTGYKLDRWHDSIWFQRPLRDGPPEPLLTPATLASHPEFIRLTEGAMAF